MVYGNYDPNLINGAMPVQQAQVPPNFQQAPIPQNFGQGFAPNAMGMYQPDAATVTGLNQTMANAIKAANAPKSPWAQGQDISNNIMGNVIMPFAGAFGAAGADDIAKGFLDKIDADKKTRQDMLKSNISQIKDITSAFDGLNRTQVAELGRKTAETNAQRMLQATANQRAVAEARLAETEKQRLMMEAHYKRDDETRNRGLGVKEDDEKRKEKKDDTLTGKLAAKYDAQTGKLLEQTKQVTPDAEAKRARMMGKTANDAKRTGIYDKAVDNRNALGQESNRIKDKNADTAKDKAATSEKLAQNKINNPNDKGAMLRQLFGGAPKVAQGAAKPGPLDHATALKFLQDAGGDKDKAREMARKAGHSF
jgi:hypothetical protein